MRPCKKTSSIRSAVSIELRLVTDTDRQTDGHRASHNIYRAIIASRGKTGRGVRNLEYCNECVLPASKVTTSWSYINVFIIIIIIIIIIRALQMSDGPR